MSDDQDDLKTARGVFESEIEALRRVSGALDGQSFARAADLMVNCATQVIVTGVGKSGHVGAKIAATLASTGTPAFFLHADEALHGDLGVITGQNVVLAVSQSGATEEVLNMLPYIRSHRVPLIAMTGFPKSALAAAADVVLSTSIGEEACPLNLAPTSSTTAQMVLGDALAVALMHRRGFSPEDFAIRHPLGALGRRLLIRASDVMRTGEANPVVAEDTPFRDAIRVLSGKRMGAVSVVGSDGELAGIFTDGDLSRLFNRLEGSFDLNEAIGNHMIRSPKRITPETLGIKALDIMETHKIMALPVVDDEGRPVGMLHEHDLVQLGITR